MYIIYTYIQYKYVYMHFYVYTDMHTSHYITLHYITLHHITWHHITSHRIALHCIALHLITCIHTYIHESIIIYLYIHRYTYKHLHMCAHLEHYHLQSGYKLTISFYRFSFNKNTKNIPKKKHCYIVVDDYSILGGAR